MTGQLWATNSLGGYLYSDELSDKLRMAVQPTVRFRAFCDAKDATDKGLKTGENFHWDVFSNVASQGGTLTETSTIPRTNFTVMQGTLTVTEYGNSVPYTGKLDNLSKLPLVEIVNKVLKNDAKKAFDTAAWNQFNATLCRIVPTDGTSTTAITLTTNGTATTTNNIAMRKEHVKLIVDLMKERNVPPYIADDYVSCGHPSTYRAFKNDLEEIHKYTERGFGMILNGEIGRYENTRFTEQTNIAKEGWTNSKSNQAVFFGEDTVAEAIVIPEEMRGAIPSDFGRSKGVAWYYLGGFGIVHNNTTFVDQTRIFKWDSAA